MLAYSKMGYILVLCKLRVWFCVGKYERFCGEGLKLGFVDASAPV